MCGACDGGGGTGSARRRRERRLRAYLKYARMSVAMALAECSHHSAPRGQRTARAREEDQEVHYTATVRTTDPPPEPELFNIYDEPGGVRPPMLVEPQGQSRAGDGRHCGSGYELVLDATVPPMRKEDDDVLGEVELQRNIKLISCWIDNRLAARDPGGGGRQVIAQVIPEVQVPRLRRVQQRTVQVEDDPVPHVPLERISERTQEQIGDPWESQTIPQKRTSKRIVEQTVDVPLLTIPQKRTSKRILEQTVDVPLQSIPQERISERIEEQIIDDPGPARGGTLHAAAAASAAAECPDDGVFRTFPRKGKSATTRCESSANLVSHSSSSSHTAHEYEYFDDGPSLVEATLSWQDQRHSKEEFRPMRACKYFLRGCCQQGSACTFAPAARALHTKADWAEFKLLYDAGALYVDG